MIRLSCHKVNCQPQTCYLVFLFTDCFRTFNLSYNYCPTLLSYFACYYFVNLLTQFHTQTYIQFRTPNPFHTISNHNHKLYITYNITNHKYISSTSNRAVRGLLVRHYHFANYIFLYATITKTYLNLILNYLYPYLEITSIQLNNTLIHYDE